MIFRVNKITIETTYNSAYNVWYAKIYDRVTCFAQSRRLREGQYEFFSGIIASVDYLGNDPFNGDCINNAEIGFTAPCLIINDGVLPCG